jgi:catechol 2,3-dioxygenase-like lactoylglutathione lyase family enzyme
VKTLRLAWLGIRTDDYEATLRLFRETLGLAVEFEEQDTVELSLPDSARVQLFARDHRYHEAFAGFGPVPLFEVDDLDEAERRLRDAGLQVGERDRDDAWEWFAFRGPDGNLYELAQRRG